MNRNHGWTFVLYGIAIFAIVLVNAYMVNELVKRGKWMQSIDARLESRLELFRKIEARLTALENK